MRRLVWLVGLSHATNHLVMLIFPAILLLVQREFGLGYAGLGAIANAGLLGYGLGALPAGMLADRLGGQRVLAVWLFGGSLACLGIGLAGTPATLSLGLAVLGIFASLHHPAGSGILVALRRRGGVDMGRAFGLVGILGNIGLAASPFLSATVAGAWGWRAAFLVGAIPGLLLCIPLWQDSADPSPGGDRSQAERHPAGRLWYSLTLPLVLLFAFETVVGFIFQGFSTFMPTLLAQHAGIPGLTTAQVTRGGSLASLALLFGGVGHVIAGRLMGLPRREAIFVGTTAASMLCLAVMGTASGVWLVIFSSALALTHFSLATMSNTLIAFHVPSRLGGTAFGITFTLAFGVGSLASTSMGLVAERWGLHAVFSALALVAAGSVLITAALAWSTAAAAHGARSSS
jgi:MFS family permease